MSARELFGAPSPNDGTMKMWEAITEMGTNDPILFSSTDHVNSEEYRPDDDGYKVLLGYYRKTYPDS